MAVCRAALLTDRERAVNKRFLPPFLPPTSNQWLLATHCFGRLIGYDGGMAIEPRKYRTNYWLLAIAWASIFIVLSFSHRICDGKGVPSAETVTAVVSNLAGHKYRAPYEVEDAIAALKHGIRINALLASLFCWPIQAMVLVAASPLKSAVDCCLTSPMKPTSRNVWPSILSLTEAILFAFLAFSIMRTGGGRDWILFAALAAFAGIAAILRFGWH